MPTGVSIRKVDGKPGEVYYPLERVNIPSQEPSSAQVKVRISAAALNHRDLFIRQHLYPGISFGVPLLADGCGTVIATGSDASAKKWMGKRVIFNPGTGWRDDPDGPEEKGGYKIMGGTRTNPLGTLIEELVIDASECEEAPEHLGDAEAAALPLTGLTAWRATFTKSQRAKPGKNLFVTGIGGGVALMTLMFASAAGANVYVSSGSEDKLQRAKDLGAAGGVNYKEEGWEKKLAGMVEGGKFDAIIDGAGGDIVVKGARMLKDGGKISVYGMTISPKMQYVMPVVMRNIDVMGSTMGSRKEFADMVKFITEKKLKPVVSRVVKGINDMDALDGLFKEMQDGKQFGKLVIEIPQSESSKL